MVAVHVESGSCDALTEICVNGPHPTDNSAGMPKCIGHTEFREVDTKYRGQDNDQMNGIAASTVISDPSGRTPMRMKRLSISGGRAGQGRIGGQIGPTGYKSCMDCVYLVTDPLGARTNYLHPEAQLASGARVAAAGEPVAGLMWLAALSG